MVLPLAIYLSVIICIVPVCLSYKTRPRIWPAATAEHYSERSLVLRTFTLETWNFKYTGSFWKPDAAILQAAEERFLQSLDHMIPKNPEAYSVNLHHYDLWPLLGTEIHITTDSNNTLVATDESYSIHIDNTNATTSYIQLAAPTHLGVLCGLQSLLQLLSFGWLDQTDSDRSGESSVVFVARNTPLTIHDTPTYSYRGLLIDTSRHYLPLSLILHNLNAMEMNKLNVLHWHITDSQSWPFLGDAFPELAMGAFCKACIYTTDDVTLIINEAKLRGIQVVVELDLPGHSQAIVISHPEFLTECGGGDSGPSEPLDVTEPAVTAFVHALYDELAGLVQSNMIHIGGDEVSLDCWKQSSKIKDWLQRHNMTNEEQLLAAFEMDLLKYTVNKLKKRPIVWQEVFDAGIQLPDDTIVDVWKEWDMTALSAASNKYDVIVSACWYLDHLDKDWYSFYRCDPRAFNGTIHQKRHILGGHASMWGERVDETNFMSRVWPRASAVAEKLWTGNVTAAEQSAAERLDRFRCFMVQRDFDASPIGPGSCARRYSDSLQPLAPLIGKTSYQ